MLKKWFGGRPQPLTGAPPVRRHKTYSAQSGYVYQYHFEGHRSNRRDGQATEYVFEFSADRRTFSRVSVFLEDDAVRAWERAHARALAPNEQYAIAKMALFQAFDERESPSLMHHPVRVRAADAEAILATLGLD